MVKAFLFFLVFAPLVLRASDVHWGIMSDVYYYTAKDDPGQGFSITMDDAGKSNIVDAFVQVELLYIESLPYYRLGIVEAGSFYSDPENILAAKYGDVVSRETVRHLGYDKYLFHNVIDDGQRCKGTDTVIVKPNELYYLAFVTSDVTDIYGWAQYKVDSSGELIITDFAYDADGGPMIVGGGAYSIPEPSGGLLFVLGAAALGLRRRRVSPPANLLSADLEVRSPWAVRWVLSVVGRLVAGRFEGCLE